MKRIVNIFIATLTTFVFLLMTISYALETTEKEEGEGETFFLVSSEEVTTGDTVEMVLNLSLINSLSFVFTLTSSIDISSIYTDENNGVEILAEENDGEYTITIEITDSSLLESSELALYYDLSDSITSGTTITLTATVTDLEDEENTDLTETTITVTEDSSDTENEDLNNGEENGENRNEFASSFESENSSESESSGMSDMLNGQSSSSQTESLTESKQTSNSDSMSGSLSSSSTEEVTYNGSSNNYLSELSIDGYSLNKDFNKESSTYFAEVEDVDSVTITATAEDSEATVCIYGAESIEDGTNKVIISVTAENGSVRYYRIYISK